MHHWTVHEKVDFPKFPSDIWLGGYIPQHLILNSEMKLKIFPISGGYIQQPVILHSEMHLKNFQTVTTCFTAKNSKMHKYKTVPTCFTTKKYLKLLPKLIVVHTHQS